MKKVSAVLMGAGNRGAEVYAKYALDHPYEIQFVAVESHKDGRGHI